MIRVQLGRARRVAIVTATALVIAGCGGGATAESDPGYLTGPGVVTRTPVAERVALPPVTGALLQGGEFDSAEYPDTVLVYNVWGSWCAPCRAEAPALQEVWEQTRDRGVQFVGVNVKDNDASARAFEREFGITYPSITTADSGTVLLAFRSKPAAQRDPQHPHRRPRRARRRPDRGCDDVHDTAPARGRGARRADLRTCLVGQVRVASSEARCAGFGGPRAGEPAPNGTVRSACAPQAAE